MDGGQNQGKEVGLTSTAVLDNDMTFQDVILQIKIFSTRSSSKATKREEGDSLSPAASDESPLSTARRLRHRITLEGAPLFGFIGVFEWLLVFIGLAALFTLQYIPAMGALHQMAVKYWLWAAGGYTALALGHGDEEFSAKFYC